MALRTTLKGDVAEGTTPLLNFTFKDEDGVATQPTTANFTLTDGESETIVNSQDDTNIITSVTAGVAALRLVAADTAILNTALQFEWRRALIEWTWGASLVGKREIYFRVRNLKNVS